MEREDIKEVKIEMKKWSHVGLSCRKNLLRLWRATTRIDTNKVNKVIDELSFADIEKNIKEISEKARDGKLTIEDLQGGTFTISNGGVYGSMLSTPILNLPQSGVLGMHNIVERPVVVDGEIKIRPIMYLALSYDHRIIDGKESVSFLKMIKENLEDPRRLFLDI